MLKLAGRGVDAGGWGLSPSTEASASVRSVGAGSVGAASVAGSVGGYTEGYSRDYAEGDAVVRGSAQGSHSASASAIGAGGVAFTGSAPSPGFSVS